MEEHTEEAKQDEEQYHVAVRLHCYKGLFSPNAYVFRSGLRSGRVSLPISFSAYFSVCLCTPVACFFFLLIIPYKYMLPYRPSRYPSSPQGLTPLSILEVISSCIGSTRRQCKWTLTNGLLVAPDLKPLEISYTVSNSFTLRASHLIFLSGTLFVRLSTAWCPVDIFAAWLLSTWLLLSSPSAHSCLKRRTPDFISKLSLQLLLRSVCSLYHLRDRLMNP
jgi:hypothetical protein